MNKIPYSIILIFAISTLFPNCYATGYYEYEQFNQDETIVLWGEDGYTEHYEYCIDVISKKYPGMTIKSTAELSDDEKKSSNLILLGGPVVNPLVGEIAEDGETYDITYWRSNLQGWYLVQIVDDFYLEDKDVLILAGWETDDIEKACDRFIENKPPCEGSECQEGRSQCSQNMVFVAEYGCSYRTLDGKEYEVYYHSWSSKGGVVFELDGYNYSVNEGDKQKIGDIEAIVTGIKRRDLEVPWAYLCFIEDGRDVECNEIKNLGPNDESTLCTDSDGGINYLLKGTAEKHYGDNEIETDICKDEKNLREAICKSNPTGFEVEFLEHECPQWCFEGACTNQYKEPELKEDINEPENEIIQKTTENTIKCEDSDSGRNYYEQGMASDIAHNSTDYCIDENSLKEYYCDENTIHETEFKCINKCMDGACLRKEADENKKESQVSEVNCDGCMSAMGECMYVGERTDTKYCNKIGQIRNLKSDKSECENDYECKSGKCENNSCKEYGLIDSIIRWIKGIFE